MNDKSFKLTMAGVAGAVMLGTLAYACEREYASEVEASRVFVDYNGVLVGIQENKGMLEFVKGAEITSGLYSRTTFGFLPITADVAWNLMGGDIKPLLEKARTEHARDRRIVSPAEIEAAFQRLNQQQGVSLPPNSMPQIMWRMRDGRNYS